MAKINGKPNLYHGIKEIHFFETIYKPTANDQNNVNMKWVNFTYTS